MTSSTCPKIEAGKMELFWETFPISDMIDDVASTIQPLVDKNENKLTIEFDPSMGFVRFDKTKLRQVLFNLLSNACKFTRKGEIKLVVRREVALGNTFGTMTFQVSDSGIGIPPDRLETLFDAYTQVDNPNTPRIRRHWTRTRHQPALLPHDGRRYHRSFRRRQGLSLHDYPPQPGDRDRTQQPRGNTPRDRVGDPSR